MTAQRPELRRAASDPIRAFAISFPQSVALRAMDGGASGYRIDFKIAFSVVRGGLRPNAPWNSVDNAYLYRLFDRDETELLVYHWQPGPEYTGPDYPHLHISAALDAQVDARNRRRIDLDKRRLPTGQVTLQAFIRMLITEFGIRPLRSDWETRLATATH